MTDVPEEPRKAVRTSVSSDELNGGKTAGDKHEAIMPIPDPQYLGPVEIEATSVKGITPGQSSLEDVEKAWGKAKEVQKQPGATLQLYTVEPFDRVEASIVAQKVTSIIIRFEKPFPANTVAQQLDLLKIQPVFVSNELGEILGQSYPERGVLLAFEPSTAPGKPSLRVSHIILEPINAEPFLLRAETNLESRYDFCLHDLDQALKLQPKNARGHWLRSRILTAMGENEKAAAAAVEAVRFSPTDGRYRVTLAKALGQTGRASDGLVEAQKAIELSAKRPHVKAQALCVLGDLAASGAKPDFKQAMQYHTQAVELADSLAKAPHPAVRTAAKEVLVDAHLGAAQDIAWGHWREKDRAVEVWLSKAAAAVDDLIKNENGDDDLRLRLAARSLSIYVGLRGSLDPALWAKLALQSGESLIDATNDAARKSQLNWDLGMALYDALQIAQMRSEQQAALKYGEAAADHLEKSDRQTRSPANEYLMGRLYFRIGAIHAIRDGDHAGALAWFDKAVPLLDKIGSNDSWVDLGRHGETLVSMGVSYWEAGKREKALSLTERGKSLMEEAVKQGKLERKNLATPYANLAAMHREMGASEKADRYDQMALKSRGPRVR